MVYFRGIVLEGILVVIGLTLFVRVKSVAWRSLNCPSELLEFERRSCLPEGLEDQPPSFHEDCAELGCTYCLTAIGGVPECFNNTRPGFSYSPSDGLNDTCESDIPTEDRKDCLPHFTPDDYYYNNAMCVALGCQWCLGGGTPYCFYKDTVGVQKPAIRVEEIRNIGTNYIAQMTRPALTRDAPVEPLESWFINLTFSSPVQQLKIGALEVESVDPTENRHFIIRPLTIDHWDPYLEGNYLITAMLDNQAPNYIPVYRSRLFYDSPPSIEFGDLFSAQGVSLKKVMERGCLTAFDFYSQTTTADNGTSVVEYHFYLEQSDVSNFTLVIPKDYTIILSTEFTVASRVYLTRYYQLVTMRLNGYATPRSGSFTMPMLYSTFRLDRDLDPEFAWMQVDGEPSSVCKTVSPVSPEYSGCLQILGRPCN